MKALVVQRIVLVTDFGGGLYVGQMRARLDALLPATPVIDLVHDLPAFRLDLAAYLLPALVRDMPDDTLYLCVVDPGVGGERAALLIQTDNGWFIGPDNGLLAPLVRRADSANVWRIGWQPVRMSASFHGRDWFVPAAARLCQGSDLQMAPLDPDTLVGAEWPAELSAILYIDHFGNLISGLNASGRDCQSRLQVGTHRLPQARTFCEVAPGAPFWYENAFGLVEIAVSQGRADQLLGLAAGDPIGPFIRAADSED
ncbi:SAM hydrolase/SAM-dependent halogenase family protein [Thiobaca trueperi]|uniref:SAM-dependent chlorinase/fluorinase n=1 Tax=Thiobaca trueperi TaxID=127458 RepID=A0A4R3N295_9GAMM|nr:SAM-dependent chlorinase/fluorinase [Thiobaca trueperi]TCT20789.1 hypothetical protein EDC35_105233 [Thiobaca trueperi]